MFLSRFPRCRLAALPTPLHRLPNFSAGLQGPDIWIKRDDLTALGLGGNKARKLEYLVGEALAGGCDALITTGGVQSNHARMTAAAAATVGLDCVLVLTGEPPRAVSGNLLLDMLFGAEVHYCAEEDAEGEMAKHAQRLREEGKTPYVIPLGGSVPVGSLGYVKAALELVDQMTDANLAVEHIFMASGSAGTAAGMALGLAQLDASVHLHTVSVSRSSVELHAMTEDLIDRTAALLGWDPGPAAGLLRVHDSYVGQGYTAPTEGGIEAIRLLAATEGILADPTYTAKALAGLVDHIRTGRIAAEERVLFWHTGGFPANFARPEILLDTHGSGDDDCESE